MLANPLNLYIYFVLNGQNIIKRGYESCSQPLAVLWLRDQDSNLD